MSSILIVEDEVLTSEYLRFVLEKAGYEAIPAGSAEEAIAVLEQRDDVATSSLLTSIYQGGLNGLQLAAVVRDRWPSINIIIVTGTVHPKGKRSRPICSKAVRCPENDRSGTSLPTLTSNIPPRARARAVVHFSPLLMLFNSQSGRTTLHLPKSSGRSPLGPAKRCGITFFGKLRCFNQSERSGLQWQVRAPLHQTLLDCRCAD